MSLCILSYEVVCRAFVVSHFHSEDKLEPERPTVYDAVICAPVKVIGFEIM